MIWRIGVLNFIIKKTLKKRFYINVDGKRVNQIFRNIIGNAIKYGYDNMRIEVTLYEGKNHVCIDVKDNGPGIPEDKLPNIFNRFYRIDHARTKDLMSTGLGLAIAKELVESHNGEIKVSSMEGIGTCFTIMLPKEMED